MFSPIISNRNFKMARFCFQDYVDAFEKILRLALTGQQETDIVNVIIECCLREKVFNPYYAFLLGRFCNKDRKYKVLFRFLFFYKFCLWLKGYK